MWALLRKFKAAMANKDFVSIIAFAEQLADLLGVSRETKELVELAACARNGDWHGVCVNGSEFLAVLAENFVAKVGIALMFSSSATAEEKIDAMLTAMEEAEANGDQITFSAVGDAPPDQKNVVPALLLFFQLIKLFREWRNR